ncbi:MAG: site-specific integrase [Collinsella intestinalis]
MPLIRLARSLISTLHLNSTGFVRRARAAGGTLSLQSELLAQLDDFIVFISCVEGLSPETVRAYGQHLEAYADWCESRAVDGLDPSSRDLRSYLAEFRRDGVLRLRLPFTFPRSDRFFAGWNIRDIGRERSSCDGCPKQRRSSSCADCGGAGGSVRCPRSFMSCRFEGCRHARAISRHRRSHLRAFQARAR